MVAIWIVGGLALLAVELHTVAFYAVFIAVGCFAAGLLALFLPDSPVWVQAAVAAIVSVIGLAAIRPFASRTFLHGSGGVVSRGVHGGLVGQEALTLDTVGDEHHPGHVQLASERWLAVTDNGRPLGAVAILQLDTLSKFAASENTKIVIPAESSALLGAAQALRSVLAEVSELAAPAK